MKFEAGLKGIYCVVVTRHGFMLRFERAHAGGGNPRKDNRNSGYLQEVQKTGTNTWLKSL